MKKKIIAILAAAAIFTSGALAATAVQTITAQLRPDIQVVVDGQKQTFTDANGNTVYAIAYNGTTYLPLRSIGNLMGKTVGWDGATKTVTLSGGTQQTAPQASAKVYTLSAGDYTVGTDIAPGKYDVLAVEGSGNFMGAVASKPMSMLNEIMAASNVNSYGIGHATMANLTLANGDTFTIMGDLVLQLTAK